MSDTFKNTDQYAATLDQLWAMLSDQSYWEGKYEAQGATNLTWIEFDAGDSALTVSSTRDVAANLPGFAKRVIGDKAAVTQTEKWTRDGDRLSCNIEIATHGAPGGTHGTMSVEPAAGGCAWSADFATKIPIPLLGHKVEHLMHDETADTFKVEKEFNDHWLAAQR